MDINGVDKGKLEVHKSRRFIFLQVHLIRLCKTTIPIQPLLVPLFQQEIIGNARVIHLIHIGVVIKQLIRTLHFHGELLAGAPEIFISNDQSHSVQVALSRPQTDLKLLIRKGKRIVADRVVQHCLSIHGITPLQ